ncbi:MAG: hypothetical protein L3K15_09390, partial [Thermoplasmata archaeon]|nr:hypothetical protein [Thermoplasmata archaeon]
MTSHPRSSRRFSILAVGLLFWIAIGVMAVPDLSGVALHITGPVAAPVGLSGAHHGPTVPLARSGASPAAVNTGPVNDFLPSVPNASSHLAFQSETQQFQYSRFVWEQRNLSAAANATAAKALVHPLLSIPTGQFNGNVRNSLTGAAIQGVTVEAYSVGSAICPATTCAPVSTSSTGAYTVTCPVGADFVQFTAAFYLTNVTYATCVKGIDTNLSTTYLVPEATVIGVIAGDTSAHEKIAGVTVQSISRDGTVTGNPGGTSDTKGVFSVAVPPLPSKILYSPPPGYIGNFSYVNATP